MKFYTDVLNKFDDFSGRATQSEYWLFTLVNIILIMGLCYIDISTGYFDDQFLLGPASGIFSLLVFLPGLAVTVRRLHDSGKSGWWFLIGLIPYLGPLIYLFLMASDGESGENQYGSDPRAAIA